MKKLLTLALVCLAYATSFGQNVPQGIAYQAVAVKDGAYSVAGQNPQAIYWSNKDIKVRFTIFDKYPNGSSQYSEVHTTSTDEYGVFNLIIGQGSDLSGDFTTIPWELGDAHLQVEIDFENTNTFTLTALEKFWSVPYAFVTNETGTSSTDSSLAALNNKFQYLKDRDKDTVIGNEGISYQALDSLNKALKAEIAALRFSDKDTVVGNELQTLSVTGDSVTISDGNTVVINHPANLDNDSTNEIQTISLSNDTISLSNGGGKVALEDINDFIISRGGDLSPGQSIYKSESTFTGSTLVESGSYGYKKWRNYTITDTLNLKIGDELVMYSNEGTRRPISPSGSTYTYLIAQYYSITDSSGQTLQGLNISHNGTSSDMVNSGLSNIFWGDLKGTWMYYGSKNPPYPIVLVSERHLVAPYSGVYYVKQSSEWDNASGGSAVTPINWRYFKIN